MHVLNSPIGPSMPCAKARPNTACSHRSARRRRQQANLEQMLTSEAEFFDAEGGPACSKWMMIIDAEEVGEEVMFTA